MTSTGYPPTVEQAAVIDACVNKAPSLVVEAAAGSGKTSTLKMVAERMAQTSPRARGLYIAFNKITATEAKASFPSTVDARTGHSLAFASYGRANRHRLPSEMRAQSPADVAAMFGISDVPLESSVHGAAVVARGIAAAARDTVANFCRSADDEIGVQHVRHISLTDDGTAQQNSGNRARVCLATLEAARALWADARSASGRLRFEHDYYRKMWALGRPKLSADYIMLDEAQDTAPVMAAVVQAQDGRQQIAVGDSCQPTGTLVTVVDQPGRGGRWTGSRPTTVRQVPIERVSQGDMVVSYNVATKYVHRNGSPVAGISSRPFDGNLIRVRTDELSSAYTPDHHCVVRFGGDIADKFVVYLMRQGDNYRVGVTGGRIFSQHKRLGLVQRAMQEHADAAWILSVHEDRTQAIFAEALAAWSFGVPDVLFRSVGHSMGDTGLAEFWSKVGGNRLEAAALLAHHGRNIDFPLWRKGERLQTRRPFVTRACNLIDGMEVLPLDRAMLANGHEVGRRHWTRITVTEEPYRGLVWSMTVENDHTYVGDGIVTHNCQQLYAWAGAVDALARWGDDATRLRLTQSWRFGLAIAEEANKWLSVIGTDMRVRGTESLASVVGTDTGERADAILCRTNVGAVGEVLTHLSAGQRVAMTGGGKEIKSLAYAAATLMRGGQTGHPELCVYSSWNEVERAASGEDGDPGLRVLVSLMNLYGPDSVIDAMNRLVPEEHADIVVSTGHKAKGREWASVRICSDFTPRRVTGEDPDVDGPVIVDPATAMLAYVAVTRAKLALDRGPLCYVEQLINAGTLA